MDDRLLNMSATISLPSGSPSSINLHDRERYELIEWLPPAITYRRTVVEGENQPGEFLIKAIPATATIPATVRVLGSSEATLRTNSNLLFRALGQFQYSITEVIEGNTHIYTRCQPADIDPVGGPDWDILRGMHQQAYALSIRCHPRTVG